MSDNGSYWSKYNYCEPLAAILRKAQGVTNPETKLDIDVGGECQNLRLWCDWSRSERARLRAALIFIRDKEQAALNEAERLRFIIPDDAGCMEILHAARAALEQKP